MLTRDQVIERFKSIKLLALDVDGVLTDDGIFFGPDGFEMKRFDISDGLYMVLAMRSGLELAIVSGRRSEATVTRMKDLGLRHVLQERKDKAKMIEPLIGKLGIEYSEVAFVGNEILDLTLAARVGLSIAVADSCKELLEVVDFVTEGKGGMGAVRETIELYFRGIGVDPPSLLA